MNSSRSSSYRKPLSIDILRLLGMKKVVGFCLPRVAQSQKRQRDNLRHACNQFEQDYDKSFRVVCKGLTVLLRIFVSDEHTRFSEALSLYIASRLLCLRISDYFGVSPSGRSRHINDLQHVAEFYCIRQEILEDVG